MYKPNNDHSLDVVPSQVLSASSPPFNSSLSASGSSNEPKSSHTSSFSGNDTLSQTQSNKQTNSDIYDNSLAFSDTDIFSPATKKGDSPKEKQTNKSSDTTTTTTEEDVCGRSSILDLTLSQDFSEVPPRGCSSYIGMPGGKPPCIRDNKKEKIQGIKSLIAKFQLSPNDLFGASTNSPGSSESTTLAKLTSHTTRVERTSTTTRTADASKTGESGFQTPNSTETMLSPPRTIVSISSSSTTVRAPKSPLQPVLTKSSTTYFPSPSAASIISTKSRAPSSSHGKQLLEENSRQCLFPAISCHQCKSTTTVSKKMEQNLFVGCEIFAEWGGFFYPAIIQEVDKEMKRLTALFEDQLTSDVHISKVLFNDDLEKDQKVLVKTGRKNYTQGSIVYGGNINGKYQYWVVIKGVSKVVGRSDLCFQKDTCKGKLDLKKKTVTGAKNVKFKRVHEPPSSSSSNELTPLQPKPKFSKMSKLFEGYYFLVTKSKVEVEETTEEFNEKLVINKVIDEGGIYIDKLTSRDILKAKIKVCITDATTTSKNTSSIKFLYCIACGIPIVHFDWLLESVKQRTILSLPSYVVPAGIDITGETIEQNIEERDPYTPLNVLRIHVHLGDSVRPLMREVAILLEKVGAEIIATNHQVTKRSKKIPFDLSSVDLVLSLSGQVTDILAIACRERKKAIVTVEWLRQCIINDKLLDIVDSPMFTVRDC